MIIDASNSVVGRLAGFVVKQALNGETVVIVNSESAVFKGNPKFIIERYFKKQNSGQSMRGPFFSKMPDRFLKKIIKGMTPKKSWAEESRGRQAFNRIRCYIGVPEEFKSKQSEFVNVFKADRFSITLKDVCRALGGKV